MLSILDWADGELLSSVRSKIRTMFTTLNQEGNYLSGTAPASPVAGQTWTNTTAGIVYQRNTNNSAWVPVRRINGPTVTTTTTTFLATANDYGNHVIFRGGSSTVSLGLPALSTVTDGWYMEVTNTMGYRLMVDANGTETIDGVLSFSLPIGGGMKIIKKDNYWQTVGRPVSDAGTVAAMTVSVPLITTTMGTPTKYNLVLNAANTTLDWAAVASGELTIPKSGVYDIYTYGRPDFNNGSGGIYGVIYYDLQKTTGGTVSKAEGNFYVNGTVGLPVRGVDFGVRLVAGDKLVFKVSGYSGTAPYGSIAAHTVVVNVIYRGS